MRFVLFYGIFYLCFNCKSLCRSIISGDGTITNYYTTYVIFCHIYFAIFSIILQNFSFILVYVMSGLSLTESPKPNFSKLYFASSFFRNSYVHFGFNASCN